MQTRRASSSPERAIIHLLFHEDGTAAGEAHHGLPMRPGDTIRTQDGHELSIVTVVRVDEQGSD